jgi:hypothetical protein
VIDFGVCQRSTLDEVSGRWFIDEESPDTRPETPWTPYRWRGGLT